jgi:hypothetical protein
MDDHTSRDALRELTDVLDASVRDIGAGAVSDAADAQQHARRMLADFEKAHPGRRPATGGGKAATRTRTA